MKPQGHVPAAAPIGAHEGADLDVSFIARLAVLLGAILVALVLATMVLFHLYEKQYPHRTSEAQPIVTAAELPPAPRLQATPRVDGEAVRAAEEAHLEGYAWVDRAGGIARIPLDRAMARWVELQNAPAANSPNPLSPLSPVRGGESPASQRTETRTANSPAPVTSGMTEQQMRQEKAKGAHAP